MANLLGTDRVNLTDDSRPDRWAQDGNTILNIQTGEMSGDTTIYTVTTQKVAYISQIIYWNSYNGSGRLNLKDGSGGSTRLNVHSGALNVAIVLNFSTPLKFEDVIYYDASIPNGVFNVTLTGWEESP